MTERPLVLAHRGASHQAPENTLSAFGLARELGADGVELDVRRTADGLLVLHHEPDVAELGPIMGVDLATLRESVPDVATLADALTELAGLIVNVEVKCLPWEPDHDADFSVMRATVDMIRAHASITPHIIVSSFSRAAVDACRALAPEIPTGWLTHGQAPTSTASDTRARGHEWLNPDRAAVLADPDAQIAACHAAGLRVSVWTVDDPDEIRTLANAGVDAIITNEPNTALAALQ